MSATSTVSVRAPERVFAPPSAPTRRRRWRPSVDLIIVLGLLAVVVTVQEWNITGFPILADDEGTYLSQAWAVQHGQGLAHYTYWYDHPPLGWLQMALLSWIPALFPHTGGGLAVAMGRTIMPVATAASAALLYALALRVGMRRPFAALTVLLFGLSPLAISMQREIYLDNIAVPWALAAFLFALSRRRHLWHHMAAGACMAVAALSKETIVVLLPALLVALWQGSHRSTRKFSFVGFASGMLLVLVFYPLYSVLKGELIPGTGHVSLIGSILFQLHDRTGSGAVWQAGTQANTWLTGWLSTDSVLIVGGTAALVVLLFRRRARALALAGLTLIVIGLRPSGYLPAMYIIQIIPFYALAIAGTADALAGRLLADRVLVLPHPWRRMAASVLRGVERTRAAAETLVRVLRMARRLGPAVGASMRSGWSALLRIVLRRGGDQRLPVTKPVKAARLADPDDGDDARSTSLPGRPVPVWQRAVRAVILVAVLAAGVVYVAPRWYDGDRTAMTADYNGIYSQAAAWIEANIPAKTTSSIVVDDVLWLNMVDDGFAPRYGAIWFYKVDLDTAVENRLPDGWQDIDYVVSTQIIRDDPPSQLPTVTAAIQHSTILATFGTGNSRIEIRRVLGNGVADRDSARQENSAQQENSAREAASASHSPTTKD